MLDFMSCNLDSLCKIFISVMLPVGIKHKVTVHDKYFIEISG